MLNKLIEALRTLEADPNILRPESGYLTDYDNGHTPLVSEIEGLACEELIRSDGSCNWKAHRLLEDAGFPVRVGESDSFGWLTGVIVTKKGMVVYG